MANVDRPHGFVPYSALLRCRPYASDGAEIQYINDVMSAAADGNVNVAAAADIVILGSNLAYHAASAATATSADPVLISDHPDQLYEAQDDGTEAAAQAELFQGFNHLATTGSTITFLSKHEIDISSGSTSTEGFVGLGFVPRMDNDGTAANADWVVQLNAGEGLLTVASGV
jgi:hypothetical protein